MEVVRVLDRIFRMTIAKNRFGEILIDASDFKEKDLDSVAQMAITSKFFKTSK